MSVSRLSISLLTFIWPRKRYHRDPGDKRSMKARSRAASSLRIGRISTRLPSLSVSCQCDIGSEAATCSLTTSATPVGVRGAFDCFKLLATDIVFSDLIGPDKFRQTRASSKRAPLDLHDGLAVASELCVMVRCEQPFILEFDGQIALTRPCF